MSIRRKTSLKRPAKVLHSKPRRPEEFPKAESVQPIGDQYIVRPDAEEEITAGGIVVVDVAKERPLRGVVLAAGPGAYHFGVLRPTEIKAGERVLYRKYAGLEIQMAGGETLLILKEDEILGRLI